MITRLLMLARLVAAFAMLTQAFAPTAMAVANPRIDPAQLICITPGNPATDVSLRMAQRLADVLNDTSDVPPVQQDHCPLCLIATAAPLPETPVVKQPRFFAAPTVFAIFEPAFVQTPRGPPVGATGPPIFY